MLNPASMLRIGQEAVIALLGGLLIVLALSGRAFVERNSVAWLGLAIVLIVIGARDAARAPRCVQQAAHYVRGGSFVIAGLLMLVMTRAPSNLVKPLVIAAGAVFVLRGLFLCVQQAGAK